MGEDDWFRDGLRFGCAQCGDCCTGEGYVWVNRREILALAELLALSSDEFGSRFLRRAPNGRLSLTDNAAGACIFWERGCQVYSARPKQCRTFPFWSENLTDPGAWKRVGLGCKGVGTGRLYDAKEIGRIERDDGEASET